jgi:hypothetical protein
MSYDDILEELDITNNNFKSNDNGKSKKKQSIVDSEIIVKEPTEKPKREFVTYKYSQLGKGSLHEAVIINGLPLFIKYNQNSKEIELIEKIEENNRILRPPEIEEYPYTLYAFESNDE